MAKFMWCPGCQKSVLAIAQLEWREEAGGSVADAHLNCYLCNRTLETKKDDIRVPWKVVGGKL